ncbi:MAG: tRNA threonylcarbamoyl adenosine modification protein, Sua5/YciO/YrdC/YwlC family [Idiomarinaceae bacterium HL-53]|nr:MAG: tRNA threonylcarbamoyl adenosine modification protein, Sua5/YciO/YrdC/YwlC family [Idiomarinaceae bacterium HL-53]
MVSVNTQWLVAENRADFVAAGELLQAGGVVALPTETVYGLAADASQPEAVEKIFAAKGRPTNHPLIVHIASIEHLERWATAIPVWLPEVLEKLWPGPLTVLLPKRPDVSSVATGGLDTIGLRMPSHPVFLNLLREFDLAVAAPSANLYQRLSPTSAEQVFESLQGRIDAVLDGGRCNVGTESTILKVAEDYAQVLRAGPVTLEMLAGLLPVPIRYENKHSEAVSGNKKVHYRPHARVVLTTAEKMTKCAQDGAGFVLCSKPLNSTGIAQRVRYLGSDASHYRKEFYYALYELDKLGCDTIYVEAPPQEPEWLDIWDRLSRAAYKNDLP